jgi:hypothetical protein
MDTSNDTQKHGKVFLVSIEFLLAKKRGTEEIYEWEVRKGEVCHVLNLKS